MREKYEINYDNLRAMAVKAGSDLKHTSLAMGKSAGWLSNARAQGNAIDGDTVRELAMLLGCEPSDFAVGYSKAIYEGKVIKECTEPKLEIRLDPSEMESEFEKFVKEMLQKIYNNLLDLNAQAKANHDKLSSHDEILMYLFNCKQQEENLKQFGDDSERAKTLLGKMLDSANGGSVTLDDFKRRLSVIGITGEDVIKEAIVANNCKTDVYGYGNNKAVWIVEV